MRKVYSFDGKMFTSFNKAYAALSKVTNLVVPDKLQIQKVNKGELRSCHFLLPESEQVLLTLNLKYERDKQIAQTGKYVESYAGEFKDNICGSVLRYPDGNIIKTYFLN